MHRATPVTMSAFIMGMLFTDKMGSRQRFFMPYRPTEAKVPATVEIRVARTDTNRVV